MPYMIAPGARLLVGPHGQLDESLGACCPPCAARGRQPLGLVGLSTAFSAIPVSAATVQPPIFQIFRPPPSAGANAGGAPPASQPRGWVASLLGDNAPLIMAGGAAVVILGGALLYKRKRRR